MISNVEINKQARLSEHFTLAEMCKTSVKTADGNIPSRVHIENLKRLCGWLERLREEYNWRYGGLTREGQSPSAPQATHSWDSSLFESVALQSCVSEEPIIINSGYRSPQVNKAVGGAATSNHLTGCAADIRCYGIEQALRYAVILLDISDETKEPFDELLIEKSAKSIWVHFAVKPEGNRRRVAILRV